MPEACRLSTQLYTSTFLLLGGTLPSQCHPTSQGTSPSYENTPVPVPYWQNPS